MSKKQLWVSSVLSGFPVSGLKMALASEGWIKVVIRVAILVMLSYHLLVIVENFILLFTGISLRKQPTFRDATTGFSRKMTSEKRLQKFH